jgi:hypothetical protein
MASNSAKNFASAETALDIIAGDELTLVHLYVVTPMLEDAVASLRAEGFDVIASAKKRYLYPEARWVWQAEMGRGSVAVHLRSAA